MAAFTALAIGLLIASTATQVYAQHKQGEAAKDAGEAGQQAANSQADLSIYNSRVADLQAQDALERGVEQESRFRSQVRGVIGSQRAGIAAGNIDVGFGSAVDVQADAAFLGELDALTVRHNAAREAWGYSTQAEDLRRRASIQRKEGSQLLAAGEAQASGAKWAMAGTILGSGSSLLMNRYGFQTNVAGPTSSMSRETIRQVRQ